MRRNERRIPQASIGVAVVIVAPLVVVLLTPLTLVQAGWIDPFLYTAYAHDFSALIERFGTTYYSLRGAHIFPALVFGRLFGSEPGYLIHRYLLLVAVAGSTWVALRPPFTPQAASAAVVGLLFSPWLLRSIFWDHYDASAIAYLFVLISLLITLARGGFRGRGGALAAGATLCLAANCNPYFFLVGAGALVALPIAWREGLHRDRAARAAATSAMGFFLTYLLLVVLRYLFSSGRALNFDQFSVLTTKQLLQTQGATWSISIAELLEADRAGVLILPVTALAGGVCLLRSRERFTALPVADRHLRPLLEFSVLYAVVVTLLYAGTHVVFGIPVIAVLHYVVGALPAFTFVLASTWFVGAEAETAAAGRPRAVLWMNRVALISGVLTILIFIWLAGSSGAVAVQSLTVLIFFCATLFLQVALQTSSNVRAGVAFGALAAAALPFLFVSTGPNVRLYWVSV